MSLYKWLTVLLGLVGLALSLFASLAPGLTGPQQVFLTTAATMVTGLGTYFLSWFDRKQEVKALGEEYAKKVEFLLAEYAKKEELLTKNMSEEGQGFLVNQYAQDTIALALSQDVLNDIEVHARSQPPNIAAIMTALKGNRHVNLVGFYAKSGELLTKSKEGVDIIKRFILHLDQIINSQSYIPETLRVRHEQFKKLLGSVISAGESAARASGSD